MSITNTPTNMLHNYKLRKQNIRRTEWKCEEYLTYFLTACWSHKSTYIDRMLPSLHTTWDTQNCNGYQERSKAVFSWRSHIIGCNIWRFAYFFKHKHITTIKAENKLGITKAKTDKKTV